VKEQGSTDEERAPPIQRTVARPTMPSKRDVLWRGRVAAAVERGVSCERVQGGADADSAADCECSSGCSFAFG